MNYWMLKINVLFVNLILILKRKNELIDSYNSEINVNKKAIVENNENIRLLNKNKR